MLWQHNHCHTELAVCTGTLQSGNKPAIHAAMLPGIVYTHQMLHHDRLQDAHSNRETKNWVSAPAGLCYACRISGADVYSERSKDFWLDLMKAASLQGEAGNSSLMVVSSNLVRSLVNVARLLGSPGMSTSRLTRCSRKHTRYMCMSYLGRIYVYVCVVMLCLDFARNGACSRYSLQSLMPILLTVTAHQFSTYVQAHIEPNMLCSIAQASCVPCIG